MFDNFLLRPSYTATLRYFQCCDYMWLQYYLYTVPSWILLNDALNSQSQITTLDKETTCKYVQPTWSYLKYGRLFLAFPIDEKRNNKSVDTDTTFTELHHPYLDTGLRCYTFPDHNFDTHLQYYMIHVTDKRNISDVRRQ